MRQMSQPHPKIFLSNNKKVYLLHWLVFPCLFFLKSHLLYQISIMIIIYHLVHAYSYLQ